MKCFGCFFFIGGYNNICFVFFIGDLVITSDVSWWELKYFKFTGYMYKMRWKFWRMRAVTVLVFVLYLH